MTARKNYTIVLEITPIAPLTHGAGTDGNEQVLMTREILVPSPDAPDGWERIAVPAVSGAAMKATLREWAVRDALELAGVADGSVSKDALRLLLKGGKNDSGGATVNLDDARKLRDLFPLLAVFGVMDGGLPIRGAISVSDVLPWTSELASAGILPRRVTPLQVSVDGELLGAPAAITVYPGVEPVPSHLIRTTTTNYRHDMRSSGVTHLLQGAAVKQIEEAVDARAGKSAKKEERREANESMPHSAQAIAAGTPMVCTIRLMAASDVEWAALARAIARWIASGAHLGGGAAKGHGACRVNVAGALRYAPGVGDQAADPGTAIDVAGGSVAETYDTHIRERAEAIRAFVAESTR